MNELHEVFGRARWDAASWDFETRVWRTALRARPMWHRIGTNPPEYDYEPRLEVLWRRAQRQQQSELWRDAA